MIKRLWLGYTFMLYCFMAFVLFADSFHVIAYFFTEETVNAVFSFRAVLTYVILVLYGVHILFGVSVWCKKNNIDDSVIGRIYYEEQIKRKEIILTSAPLVISVISSMIKSVFDNKHNIPVDPLTNYSPIALAFICQHGVLVYKWLKRCSAGDR